MLEKIVLMLFGMNAADRRLVADIIAGEEIDALVLMLEFIENQTKITPSTNIILFDACNDGIAAAIGKRRSEFLIGLFTSLVPTETEMYNDGIDRRL